MAEIDMRKGYDPVTILIYDRKKDLVFEEISLIALNRTNNKVVAVGNDAKSLLHTNNDNILLLSPLKNGVIADYAVAQIMFKQLLQKNGVLHGIMKPKIAVCIPVDLTEVERKAFTEAFHQAGAKEITLSEVSHEETNQTLSASYGVLVEIVHKQEEQQQRKEIWHEVQKGRIPVDDYKLTLIKKQKTDVTVTLSGAANSVALVFYNVFAMRTLEKIHIQDDLYTEDQLQRFRAGSFQNVLYQIEDGEFGNFIQNNDRGKVRRMHCNHYLIISEDTILEVVAEQEPDIVV